MEEAREQAVWARVLGTKALPICLCAQCAGVLRWLWKQGVCREATGRLLERELEQLDTLRGLCGLTGAGEPAWVMAEPQGMTPRQAAAQCVGLLERQATAYAQWEREPSFGGLFRILSEDTWRMAGQMLRIVQRLGGG